MKVNDRASQCDLCILHWTLVVNMSERRVSCCIVHVWKENSGVHFGPNSPDVIVSENSLSRQTDPSGSESRTELMYLSTCTLLSCFNGLHSSPAQTGQLHNQRWHFPWRSSLYQTTDRRWTVAEETQGLVESGSFLQSFYIQHSIKCHSHIMVS